MARPAAQLLGNGDILVPLDGAGMARLHPEDAGYEDWLARIQDSNRPAGLAYRALTFWGVGLALVIGIWLLIAVVGILAGSGSLHR